MYKVLAIVKWLVPLLVVVFIPLQRVIVQKLLNQIHMGHKHTPAAVSDQEQGIQGIPLRVVSLEQVQVCVPLVANHLSTGEAAHGDNHLGR